MNNNTMTEITELEIMNELSNYYNKTAEIDFLKSLDNQALSVIEDYSDYIIMKIKAAYYLGVMSH